MCGIAGTMDLNGRPADAALVARMCDLLRHRGPDEGGLHADGPVALGQRRLSIIDLSTGKQPMSNEDGTVWITFNGEIYNFQELRQDLLRLGHRFATNSDTETIIHAYEEFGADCLEHLRGMFAFAIWDQRKQRLFVARDRVGKKPLFYAIVGGRFVFASELQALLADGEIPRTPDPMAIDAYLAYGYIPAPKTPFASVQKLPPAHCLTLQPGTAGQPHELRVDRYWRLSYQPKRSWGKAEAMEALVEELSASVRLRMIADVPLGALLSGGVDSSMVVALMRQATGGAVKTFSIGFDEASYNELPYARLVAQRYETEHHELVVRPQAMDVLPKLVRHYGEPFADSSAVPTYYVSQMTRQHVTVALNGDGGDECLAGYDRYLGSRLSAMYRRLPRLARRSVIEPVAALIPDSLPRRNRLRQAKRFVRSAAMPFANCYAQWVSYFSPADKQSLYTQEFCTQLDGHSAQSWLTDLLEEKQRDNNELDAVLATDVESYLPYDLLVKMDIASMANSLEARSPFLDHRVMEFCARLPIALKRRGTTMKYLLKEVARTYLPHENIDRRKMGFGVPVAEWLRSELRPMMEDLVFAADSAVCQYLVPAQLRALYDDHCRAGVDHSQKLWAVLWLEMWHREFAVSS